MHSVAYAKYGPLVIRLELSRSTSTQDEHAHPSEYTVASEPPSSITWVNGQSHWHYFALGAMSSVLEIPEPLIATLDRAADGDWILVDETTYTILGGLPNLDPLDDLDGILMDGTPYERPDPAPRRIRDIYRRCRSAESELRKPDDEL